MSTPRPMTSQISRHVFSDMTADPTYHRLSAPYREGGYLFMLREDCRAFPLGNDRVQATLTQIERPVPGWDTTVVRALEYSSPHHGGHLPGLGDALEDFSQFCLHQVLHFGEAAYEIAYTDPDADGKWQTFRLALVHPYRRRFGRHRHYKAAVQDLPGEWVTIPDDRIVVFRLEPKGLRNDLKSAVAALQASGLNWGVGMAGLANAGIDTTEASRGDAALLARATRNMGWNARWNYDKYVTAPYLVLREFRFAKLEAELREMIIRGVQEALDKTVPILGVRSKLSVECHPTIAEIEQAMHELEAGPGRDKSLWQLERPIVL